MSQCALLISEWNNKLMNYNHFFYVYRLFFGKSCFVASIVVHDFFMVLILNTFNNFDLMFKKMIKKKLTTDD